MRFMLWAGQKIAPWMVAVTLMAAVSDTSGASLNLGDILVTESVGSATSGIVGGGVIQVNPNTGAQTLISSGGNLVNPFGITLDAAGQIIVADSAALGGGGAVIRIDPTTGAQTVVSSGGNFVNPRGVAIDTAGQIIVVDSSGAVIRIDPTTGAQTVVSSGGEFVNPFGIVIDTAGDLLITDPDALRGGQGGVIRVDPVTGAQTTVFAGFGTGSVSSGKFLDPFASAIDADGNLQVVDANSIPISGLPGAVIQVDPNTETQTIISGSGGIGNFVDPLGIVIDAVGNLLVIDANAFGGVGGVIRVDPVTGAQTVVSSGDHFLEPLNITVVSAPVIVPLPAAVWMGLTLLGTTGVVAKWRR